ncbi:methyltransferase family protein [Roseicella aerolata]|uniref:Isoprenylcysteine carboxylmethyltransferase family protein n=1 Tax=Roseicella aerolata TaxID=2883479 RepID=A0A9X1LA69_9PROT|nr:isoprenylcysteine carboxylmethyltransferase family protein [Roseicella aerolata]MCB4821905.1 isoprenylcysteine carboxylmethyltransferase family protein [Roseicella aerolata]
MSARDHGPGVRLPLPLLVGGVVLGGWMMRQILPVQISAPLPGLSAAVMGLGLALSIWTVVTMLRAGTDPRPDKPDQALVERGPFRFSRNPIYLGFLLVATGFALRWGDLWPWLSVAWCFLLLDRMVVAREEAYLRRRFGAAYEAYMQRVRRWV